MEHASAAAVGSVLRVPAFRRLFVVLATSSFGDWLGLLATTALAAQLATSYRGQTFAIGFVLLFRLLPAVLLGPLAGAFADRFDRRATMVVCDVLRFGFFVSIPLVGRLDYLFAASFVIEAISLFWIPAKEASVPNLVPREQLEGANQLSLIVTYGSAPVAALVFAVLSRLTDALAGGIAFFAASPVDLALYLDAATFLFSALVVSTIHQIRDGRQRGQADEAGGPGLVRSIAEGWRFVGQSRLTRGIVIGMLGAFCAGGIVIATGRQFAGVLGGGNAAYGVLFGSLFLGLASGMGLGSRLLPGLSRRRLCGLSIIGAGLALVATAVMPNLVLAVLGTIGVGLFAGVGWVTGYTLIGLEVADDLRGRTFALLQSLVRVDLLLTLSVAPFIVGFIGNHRARVGGVTLRLDGVTLLLLAGGIAAAGIGVVAFRALDDRVGVTLYADVVAALRGEQAYRGRGPAAPGLFLALEGGEGTGKSTQAAALADWLRGQGREVVETREPGGTGPGRQIRALLLDPATDLSARAEALLYAADRAEHVATVIRPALERGAVVVSDRFVDSSFAYQGAGRALSTSEVARVNRFATEDLVPDLTVLLDLDPQVGLARVGRRAQPDRLEGETLEFHGRVRERFLALAGAGADRYAVVPAGGDSEQVQAAVRAAVHPRLGLPASVRVTAGAGTR